VIAENGFAVPSASAPCRRLRNVPIRPPAIRSWLFWVHVAAICGSAVHTQKSVPFDSVRS
jgi:hypothetical protein